MTDENLYLEFTEEEDSLVKSMAIALSMGFDTPVETFNKLKETCGHDKETEDMLIDLISIEACYIDVKGRKQSIINEYQGRYDKTDIEMIENLERLEDLYVKLKKLKRGVIKSVFKKDEEAEKEMRKLKRLAEDYRKIINGIVERKIKSQNNFSETKQGCLTVVMLLIVFSATVLFLKGLNI
jgi:hypothetical protein